MGIANPEENVGCGAGYRSSTFALIANHVEISTDSVPDAWILGAAGLGPDQQSSLWIAKTFPGPKISFINSRT